MEQPWFYPKFDLVVCIKGKAKKIKYFLFKEWFDDFFCKFLEQFVP